MRLGCTGCLSIIMIAALVAGGVSFGVSTVRGMLQTPELPSHPTSQADGVRAQQKLFELVTRGKSGAGPRPSIVLSEQELTAFLDRHLVELDEIGFKDISARLPGDGRLDFTARVPVRALLRETLFARMGDFLPARWLERPIWLRVQARPRLAPSPTRPDRRYLRLDIDWLRLGRQRLPTFTLRLLLAPASLRLLQWPLPDAVDAISVETGQVVIRAAS